MKAKQLIYQSALEGFVSVQDTLTNRLRAVGRQTGRLAEARQLSSRMTMLVPFLGALSTSGVAYAAGGGCSSGAAGKLVDFIDQAASFMIGIGAAGALLMFAVGAGFIIFGGKSDRVRQGMSILKNAVIGLAVLAGGIFIKYIVVNFVSGATGGKSADNCLKQGAGTEL